jgi:putative peptide zinc metalloprotease protein
MPLPPQDFYYPKVRQDLEWVWYADTARWVAVDGVTSAFFYLSLLEYECVRRMDGAHPPSEIVAAINSTTLYKPINLEWIKAFIKRLRQSQLLVSNGSFPIGQSLTFNQISKIHLHDSSSARPRSPKPGLGGWLIQSLSNPLCIRFPLIQPGESGWIGRFLAHLLWNPITFSCLLVSLVVVMLLVAGRVYVQSSISFEDLSRIQGDRLLLLGVVYVFIKALHELGHYLACVRWNVRCREIGVMLLVFAPSLYCDTTDSWRLSSKWQRAAIAAGGIYIELLIAMLAGVCYLSTGDGLLNTIAAQAILVCGISTIIVNGNPFFRYDGYYIASDLWGVPNLAIQSQNALWQSFIHALGGRAPDSSNFDQPVRVLSLFCVASLCYRGMIFLAIIAILWKLLVPLGLGLFALLMIATLCLGFFFYLKRLARHIVLEFFMEPPIRIARVVVLVLFFIGFAWAAYAVPIPLSIRARCFLDYETRKPLYCHEASVLNQIGYYEKPLEMNDLIFQLDNVTKRREILELENELKVLDVKIEVVRKTMVDQTRAAFELPTLQELKKEWEAKLVLLRQEANTLKEVASNSGVVYPSLIPVTQPIGNGRETKSLGRILDSINLGCEVAQGTLLGWFVPNADEEKSSGLVAHTAVLETDLRWLSVGMNVYIQCDAIPGTKIPATVKRIAAKPLDETPTELIGDFGIVSLRDQQGRLSFEHPHYLVIVEANDPMDGLNRGTLATAEFSYRELTLVQWIKEKIRLAFQYEKGM